jgi:hypothetical protein
VGFILASFSFSARDTQRCAASVPPNRSSVHAPRAPLHAPRRELEQRFAQITLLIGGNGRRQLFVNPLQYRRRITEHHSMAAIDQQVWG